MALISDEVLDAALDVMVSGATQLDICSAAPADYAGIAAVSLGNKGTLTMGAIGDRSSSGRKFAVPAITDGTVTASGDAAFWALSDGSSKLYAVGALAATKAVTEDDTFALASFDIGIPDPA